MAGVGVLPRPSVTQKKVAAAEVAGLLVELPKAEEMGVLVAPHHCEEATRAEPGVVVAVGQVTTTTSGRCLVASNHWVLLESPPEARHGPP